MFCQKCGKELEKGADFCNDCGNNVTQSQSKPTYSIQDFLAISPEYSAKRKQLRRVNGITSLICIPLLLLCCGIGVIALFTGRGMGIFLMLQFIGFIFGMISATSPTRCKNKLEKYGEELFQQYIKKDGIN